ncbi:TrkH family potassium uptake protein [Tepidiforma sp.]|uniref:TrkH family potassium uptake protein n=1 Tax=Tepidiforma sp. TaxID=2682230 RepID=UPI002ADE219B|nr:potassium transporter TrkG [Tepidiforma sp.]
MSQETRAMPRGILTTRMRGQRRRPVVGSGVARLAAGFGAILLVGTLILVTPLASEGGDWVHPRDALFTAVSAICVTGLTVVDTPTHWSNLGEATILVLIQIGGLGYMVGTTVVMWALGRQIGIRDRNMLRLYYGAPSMSETFSFARSVALFTLIMEGAGSLILWGAFRADGVPAGQAAWWGIFHSVSAFNNAGFSLTGRDMVPYTDNPVVLGTLIVLIIMGGIGFLPVVNLMRRRSFRRLPLDNKLIYTTSAALLVAGMLFTALVEWNNRQTLGGLPWLERPLVALFQSTSARTAGFSAIDMSALHDQTKLATIGLMFIGAAAGSTGGGLKVGAFSLLFAVMIATIRGEEEVSAFRKRIPLTVIQQATTLALYHVALVFGFSLALTFAADRPFIDLLFEAQSALSTVGLSTTGTVSLGPTAHFILILAMLAGRFSPVMLVLYMTRPHRKVPYHHPVDSVRLS